MELCPTIFIDRDGVLNADAGYINHERRFFVFPYAAQAVRLLNMHGFICVIVSNQTGVGLGFYSEEFMNRLNFRLVSQIEKGGGKIAGVYCCPHDKNSKTETYRLDCDCRKPKTGLLNRAAAELPVDKNRTFFIGDKYSDMQTGFNFGSRTVMVKTGYGLGELKHYYNTWSKKPEFIAENLLEAADIVIRVS
jgi:D-glycero-D-manno-heptose 1,7-bisphosphate phosphatase